MKFTTYLVSVFWNKYIRTRYIKSYVNAVCVVNRKNS